MLDPWIRLIGVCRSVVVVRECCWGGVVEAHNYSLNKAMKMYARIRTLEQTIALLAT